MSENRPNMQGELICTQAAELYRLKEALTPSADTKAAYSGEFYDDIEWQPGDEGCGNNRAYVSWTTIKEIMAAILKRAEQAGKDGEA